MFDEILFELTDSQRWNFALYNGLGAIAIILFIMYTVFLWEKFKQKDFGWGFELAIGVWIGTLSRIMERVYYGALRALQFEVEDRTELLSPAWVISIAATIGIIGLAWHVRTLSKVRFGNGFLKGALWITLGTIVTSLVWSLLF